MAKKSELHMYIYRDSGGLRARVASPDEYKKMMRSPGMKTHTWVAREKFPFDLVVAYRPDGFLADQIDYLCETQISFWPAFHNGLALEWAGRGIGGS